MQHVGQRADPALPRDARRAQRLARRCEVLLAHRVIYVPTPKVGSSTLVVTFRRLALGDPSHNPSKLHDPGESPLKVPADILAAGYQAAKQWINRPEFRRVCFVRNPYSRLLSCYIHRFHLARDFSKENIRAQLGFDKSAEVTFGDFVAAVGRQSSNEMHGHWRIQTAYLMWKDIAYDFVGRLEDFDAELDRLCAFLGIDLHPYLDVRDRHATGAPALLKDYYTSQLQEQVYDIYRDDFEILGYPRELPP